MSTRGMMMGATPKAGRLAVAVAILLAAGDTGAGERDRAGVGEIPVSLWRYAERWIARHDADRDGSLVATEWQPLGVELQGADADQDGVLSVEELAQYLANYDRHRKIRLMPAAAGGVVPLPSFLRPGENEAERPSARGVTGSQQPPEETPAEARTAAEDDLENASARSSKRKYYVLPSRLPASSPDWFQKCDRDGDGQLTLAKYAQHGSASAEQEFARFDRNRDGLVTPQEVLGPAAKR